MRVLTTGDLLKETMTFIALMPASKEDITERLRVRRDDNGNQTGMKTDRHGKQTYSVSIKVLDQDGREARNTYVSVREPSDIPALTPLAAVGEVEINTFGDVMTLIVDKFVPAKADNPLLKSGGGEN